MNLVNLLHLAVRLTRLGALGMTMAESLAWSLKLVTSSFEDIPTDTELHLRFKGLQNILGLRNDTDLTCLAGASKTALYLTEMDYITKLATLGMTWGMYNKDWFNPGLDNNSARDLQVDLGLALVESLSYLAHYNARHCAKNLKINRRAANASGTVAQPAGAPRVNLQRD